MTEYGSRGPRREQIDGGDPTFRVEVEYPDGRREVLPHSEEMESWQALHAAERTWKRFGKRLRAVHVVNERSGFTRDTISRG